MSIIRLRHFLLCSGLCLAVASCGPRVVRQSPPSVSVSVGSGAQVWRGGEPGWHIVRLVTLENTAFVPQRLRIQKGTAVIWRNRDPRTHTIIGDTLPNLRSPVLRTGESTTFLFDRPGTFAVHCGEHPSMTSIIEVTE